MNRRAWLTVAATAASIAARATEHQTFVAGIVPAGRGRTRGQAAAFSDQAAIYWGNCDEASELGFHHIEINNTRAQIAELFAERVAEFRDEMARRHLSLAGLALFSHMAESSMRKTLIESHMLLGRFLSAVGGRYITHMIAPGTILNEPDSGEAYSHVDLKEWAANANEIGKRLLNEYGVALAYHPEQGEVRIGLHERILAASDERYLRLLVDTGHIASGGADAAAVCRKYRSRLECVHLKQFKPDSAPPIKAGNVPFGEGVVDLPAVIDVLRDTRLTGFVMSEGGGTNRTMRDYMTGTLNLAL